jgi:hypothetical protein
MAFSGCSLFWDITDNMTNRHGVSTLLRGSFVNNDTPTRIRFLVMSVYRKLYLTFSF